MADGNKSKIEELNENLNSRAGYVPPRETRQPVDPIATPDVREDWDSEGLSDLLMAERRLGSTSPFMKKVFVFAVIFFVTALLIAGYVFFGGSNFISSKNVDISVVGPTSASAGDILELGLTVKNKNNAGLDVANLSVTYPSGTRSADDTSQSLTYTKESLGKIKAGDDAVRNVRAVLFGSPGEVKTIKFTVEYKVNGSNATFYKDKIYEVTIGDAPVTIEVDGPDKVTSGDLFTNTVSIELNSTETIKDVMVRGEYPYGYTVNASVPPASAENNVWSLGDLAPGAKRTIQIKGSLVGENSEERTFRFYVGVGDAGASNPNFKTVIASTQNTVAIERPSIGATLSLNGDTSDVYTAPIGGRVNGELKIENNMPDKLLNPRVEVRLSGQALNKTSVSAQNGGFYDSANSKINWNVLNSEGQAELKPGEDARVAFNFASLATLTSGASRDIKILVIVTGTPAGKPSVSVTESKTVRIASAINMSSKMLYSRGPFANTGPLPPQAGKETTYTAVIDLGNTSADISGGKVTMRLGTNVKWKFAHTATGEDVTYDEKNNLVTWNVGTLSSGSGFSAPGREAVFQVALTPSSSQVGSVPVLVNNIIFNGTDTATGSTVSATNGALTTRLSTDPTFVQGDDIVVK